MVFKPLLPLPPPPGLYPKMTYSLPANPGQEGEFEEVSEAGSRDDCKRLPLSPQAWPEFG